MRIICHRHPNRDPEHEYEMKEGETTGKDGKVEKFLYCPKCFVQYPLNEKNKQRILGFQQAEVEAMNKTP